MSGTCSLKKRDIVTMLAECSGYFRQWTGHDNHGCSYKGGDLANGGLYSCGHSMNLHLFFLSALSWDLKDMLGCKNIQRILCITFFGFSFVLKMLKFEAESVICTAMCFVLLKIAIIFLGNDQLL